MILNELMLINMCLSNQTSWFGFAVLDKPANLI